MKIAAYCRVSTDKDEQIDSLAHQKEFFNEYAMKNGYELVRLYADEGISGTSLKKRIEFQKLMQDAKLGFFQMVVVKDISRFARNTVDFLQSVRTLKSLGINTLFLTANMESLGESEFILTVFSALAQEESINLSKRVKFGKKINAQKGRVPQRIYGYNRIDNFTLEINFQEADVVKKIFRLYLNEGLGCRAICLELNKSGYRTKFDCDWNPRAVRRILMNPIYCGEYINNKYEVKDCLEGKIVRLPKEQHIHHIRPEWAIVSKESFQSVQTLLNERRKQYTSGVYFTEGRNSNKHIFSTLIKCEHCGRSFCRKKYTYVNTRVYWKCTTNDQYTAERCDNRVTVDERELLTAIYNYIMIHIQDKEKFIKNILKKIEIGGYETGKSISKTDVEKEIKKLQVQKDKYREMYVADVITMHELKDKVYCINEKIEELNKHLDLIKNPNVNEETNIDIAHIRTESIGNILSLENITNADIRKIITCITVNRDGEIRIRFRKFSEYVIA